MEPYAESLGALPALAHLYEATHTGSDAHFLRGQYTESGSTEGMVHAAINKFRDQI